MNDMDNTTANSTQSSSSNTTTSDESRSSPVLFQTYPTHCGHLIAEICLNDSKALNALSVDMCQMISAQLIEWQHNDAVMAVLLRGSGDKAFCAGGNIRKLYDSMCEHQTTGKIGSTPDPYATEFFGSEYDLYRQMHFYDKPLILWGSGIVMGGGLGLMAACSHRIVTETTRFAMPEISIGLFPDATGSWFLQRMPAKVGLFLGLTGAQCHAADAMLVNLAEFVLPSGDYEQVVNALEKADWPSLNQFGANRLRHAGTVVSQALSHLTQSYSQAVPLSPSKLVEHWQAIHTLMNCGGLKDIDTVMQDDRQLATINQSFAEDSWSQKAIGNYRRGCPVTAALTYELYHKVGGLSLEQILYLETNVAINCANRPDFKEGVRALLIDKDKNPQWSMSLDECLTADGQTYIDAHFDNLYPTGEHPFGEWLTDKAFGVRSVY
ncbi:MAG: enoyl-CoA hydratase/isomerase family protein [Psychrobacter sp.]|nr:enoyl-CoA hydratase/isomerase family protein [Psychrobacter sp.]